jgi:hypothetical protein
MQHANPFVRRYVSTSVQSLVLFAGQNYAGASLHIPIDLVYDALPAGLVLGANDFEIDAHLLNRFNRCYWSRIG